MINPDLPVHDVEIFCKQLIANSKENTPYIGVILNGPNAGNFAYLDENGTVRASFPHGSSDKYKNVQPEQCTVMPFDIESLGEKISCKVMIQGKIQIDAIATNKLDKVLEIMGVSTGE